MTMDEAKIGDTVVFKPGPKSKSDVTAEVTDKDGVFLVTKDSTGMVRRIRAGAARKA